MSAGPGLTINRSLAREDFPFTLVVYRSDDHAWCWAVTLLAPPGDALVPLYVPPLAVHEGVPVWVQTTTAQGQIVTTGPYGDD